MLERKPTRYDDLIYPQAWREWKDPVVPAWFNPVESLLQPHLAERAGATAIIADGMTVSYGELWARMERTASALRDAGVGQGERILFFGTDSLDYICAWLASIYIGAVPAVVSDLYKARDLHYFIVDTAAATLFIDVEQMPKLAEVAGELPESLRRVICRGAAPVSSFANVEVQSLSALVARTGGRCPGWKRHSDDICYMFYSGGTTGTAKGITHLAHDFHLVPARQGAFWGYSADDVVYASSRKYFTHGLWPGVLIPLAFGAAVVLDRRGPSPDVVIDALQTWKVTKFITVPTVIKNMLEFRRTSGQSVDLSSVGLVISASEKIPPEIFDRFRSAFGLEILDSIGSSEITYEWIANRPEERKTGSLGKPVYGYEIRLVGQDGEDIVEPHIPGEAWVKSRTACFFYWRKYDKSRETFIGPWTRTGDSLYFDEDGFFWFNSRESDVFKVRGLWVSPIEIEAAITSHPAVLEAAVVSFSDAEGFTQPRAFVVLRTGSAPSDRLAQELLDLVRPLGGYKVPAKVDFIDALPRTTLLKIDRKALRGQ